MLSANDIKYYTYYTYTQRFIQVLYSLTTSFRKHNPQQEQHIVDTVQMCLVCQFCHSQHHCKDSGRSGKMNTSKEETPSKAGSAHGEPGCQWPKQQRSLPSLWHSVGHYPCVRNFSLNFSPIAYSIVWQCIAWHIGTGHYIMINLDWWTLKTKPRLFSFGCKQRATGFWPTATSP